MTLPIDHGGAENDDLIFDRAFAFEEGGSRHVRL